MKKIFLFLSCITFSLSGFTQEGKNLELNAVLELFKDSKSVEDFESELNSEKSEVNNLDLNKDGFVDYIRVIENKDENLHTLTLQVPLSENDNQDIAVIELEDHGDNTSVQIIGDKDLYGENYIVEPVSTNESTAYNAKSWNIVKRIYTPNRKLWISPWRFNRHPKIYKRWKPVNYSVYSGRVKRHRVHYRKVTHRRAVRAKVNRPAPHVQKARKVNQRKKQRRRRH